MFLLFFLLVFENFRGTTSFFWGGGKSRFGGNPTTPVAESLIKMQEVLRFETRGVHHSDVLDLN